MGGGGRALWSSLFGACWQKAYVPQGYMAGVSCVRTYMYTRGNMLSDWLRCENVAPDGFKKLCQKITIATALGVCIVRTCVRAQVPGPGCTAKSRRFQLVTRLQKKKQMQHRVHACAGLPLVRTGGMRVSLHDPPCAIGKMRKPQNTIAARSTVVESRKGTNSLSVFVFTFPNTDIHANIGGSHEKTTAARRQHGLVAKWSSTSRERERLNLPHAEAYITHLHYHGRKRSWRFQTKQKK